MMFKNANGEMQPRYWYAVQYGDCYDIDGMGNTVKRKAFAEARSLLRDHDFDGMEIRVVKVDAKYGDYEYQWVLRDGTH